jgi:hypothetical protein
MPMMSLRAYARHRGVFAFPSELAFAFGGILM